MAVRRSTCAFALVALLFTCFSAAIAHSSSDGLTNLHMYLPFQDDATANVRSRRTLPEGIPKDVVTPQSTSVPTLESTLAPNNKTASPNKNATSTSSSNVKADAAKNVTLTTSSTPRNGSAVDDFNSDEFTELQETLLASHNVTNIKNDTHEYYNSTFIVDKNRFEEYWKMIMNSGAVITTPVLSQSHKRAVIVNLSFGFPFYGHYVWNITIATGGFLYMGDYVHKWIAATQFIAPLMANFDAGLHNDSFVKYIDNGTSFTVIWENVTLQDKNQSEKFTFATHLLANGDITFAYKSVPIPIDSIRNDSHPVKVGLSDAFIIDKMFFLSRRKSIYEYHLVDFRSKPITNNTLIYLTALPTCLQYNTCSSCIQHETGFNCAWCPNINRCSHGNDRNRQDWIIKNCEETKINKLSQCQTTVTVAPSKSPQDHIAPNISSKNNSETTLHPKATNEEVHQPNNEGGQTAVTVSLVALLTTVGLLAWLVYAYRNPHTYSGQLLIKYRPSQWSWRRGEARYTAATIHM
ncbi:plexin domain containing lethal (1) G0289 isoform X2 [Arctopsyche grandis]|uniref:plexin domain containing lethal (1) G0289 isoform X2 n=1 Tax=Arctopsyche grandis TaxID=121162 RepID=UPI00406D812C